MKTWGLLLALLVCRPAAADEVKNSDEAIAPLQIAIMAPYQLFSETRTVFGIRLDLAYGYNRKVYGLDVGVINDSSSLHAIEVGLINVARDEAGGLMLGAMNYTPDLVGLQVGGINYAKQARGGQVGGINWSDDIIGCQLGGINIAKKAKGAQIGMINFAWNLKGVQIGPLNYAHNAMGIGFLPVFNYAFK